MTVANPAGINGPRPRMTTGRLRNTAINVASKTTYPTTVAPRPTPIPNAVGPPTAQPLPWNPATPGRVTTLPFQPTTTSPLAGPNLGGIMAQLQGLQAQGAALQAAAAMQAKMRALIAQMQQTVKKGTAGYTGGPLPTGGGSAGANQTLGRKLAAQMYGWKSSGEWAALQRLWNNESGWRTNAANPTSSARGIPQAMMSVHFGRNWQTNPAALKFLRDPRVQILWGLRYIARRYGSPSRALAFQNAHHWY